MKDVSSDYIIKSIFKHIQKGPALFKQLDHNNCPQLLGWLLMTNVSAMLWEERGTFFHHLETFICLLPDENLARTRINCFFHYGRATISQGTQN